MKGDLFMQINNNVQSPNFGMALKISKGAKKALENCSNETIEELQKAGEALKDTKFFHVKIDDNLGAKIDSDENAYFGFFKTDEYFANRNGVHKFGGKEVPDERIIMIENDRGTIAGVGRYVPYNETKPFYNTWGVLGAYKNVNDIKYLAKIAKILDSAAVSKYTQGVEQAALENAEKAKVSQAVSKLLDTYGE